MSIRPVLLENAENSREMLPSKKALGRFLLAAACCNQVLAFQPTQIRGQQSPRFAYSDYASDEFESLVEAATLESKGVYGGDFAGLAATFNPGDGSFIPIPEYLIPDGLLEWGQEPKCLEVLVSEDVHSDASGEDNLMTRVTTTILPDTGCSVDNLETMVAKDEIDLESQLKSDESNDDGVEEIVGLQYPLGEDKLRVETIFGLGEEFGVDRIRVAIDLVPSEDDFAIKSPMMLTLERRTSSISSGGTISEGGGLDGRTVYMLLGERLRASRTFVDEPVMNYDNPDPTDDIRHLNFPGYVSIAYGWLKDKNSWMLQVSQISGASRRVMSREFTTAKDGELDFEMQSWVEDYI